MNLGILSLVVIIVLFFAFVFVLALVVGTLGYEMLNICDMND